MSWFIWCIWRPRGHFMAWYSGFTSEGSSAGQVLTILQAHMIVEDSKLLTTSWCAGCQIMKSNSYDFGLISLLHLNCCRTSKSSTCAPPAARGNDLTDVVMETHPHPRCLSQWNQFETLASRLGYICVSERGPLKIHRTIGRPWVKLFWSRGKWG